MPSVRLLAVPAAVAAVALLGACSSSSKDASGSGASGGGKAVTMEITLTDAGCEPNSLSASAGPTTFHVTNDDAAGVTEFEVLDGSRIVGEVENVTPGLDRSFSLTLKPGSYTTKCTGGDKENGTLEVAEVGSGKTGDPAAQKQAVDSYLAYVKGESDQLVTATQAFAAAVKAGNIDQAKSLFAPARAHYEAIEPIAESFGDLDPAIDARDGDVPADKWTGFHRIEKALWVDNTTDGMGPVADQLVKDVITLQSQIPTLQLEPAQIANGAVELLNEVSASKITGEEDRYSHTDLSDFEANVIGAKQAFTAVQPLLAASDAALATTIDQRFTDVTTALDKYKTPGGTTYVAYTTLTPDDTRALSTKVDALAEPLSKVAALVIT